MTRAADGFEVKIHAQDGVATALVGDVMLVVWSAPPQLGPMRFVLAKARVFLDELPDTVLVMQVVLPAPGRPDRQAFIEAGRVIGTLRSRVRRFVSVPLGDGVRAMIVRAVMRTIAVAAGSHGEMVVESSVEDALVRLRHAAGARTPTPEVLSRALEELTRAATSKARAA